IASVSAKQMLNIRRTRKEALPHSASLQKDDVKLTTEKDTLRPKGKTRGPSITTPTPTELEMLTE
ncbi:hypothetical protein EV182_008821, partial [Spiromyces aspiralis]